MPPPSRTPYAILGCLTVEPMTGYDIKSFLDSRVVHFWQESYSQIYPALKALSDDGLVEGRTEEGQKGREKTVYRITEAGREKLREWLARPAAPVVPRYEHSLKLFFGANVGPEVCMEHLERLRSEAGQALELLRSSETRLEAEARRRPRSHAPYQLAVLRGGLRYFETVERWCDETEEALADLPGARS